MSTCSVAVTAMMVNPFLVSRETGRSEEHFHVRAVDFDLIDFDLPRRIVHTGSGGDVELPTMPRAGHHLAFHVTFAERPSAVNAGIIDGVKHPVDIEEGNGLPLRFRYDSVAWLNIPASRHPYELSHGSPSPSVTLSLLAERFFDLLQ
ncbi:protein of unknown function [Nitrospira japonica]|uniref:Uncharacterized protein n=1 Tax=Nitrospira japonica TaxID=1325564 RepID=A0A1W1I9G8_9BACT|nr:protein of unknown function [Nitrospira japonica]